MASTKPSSRPKLGRVCKRPCVATGGAARIAALADGGQHYDHGVPGGRVILDDRDKSGSIHAGHLVIDDRNGVRVAFQERSLECAERLFSRSAASIAHTPTHHLFMKDPAIHFVIVHDEDARATQLFERDGRHVGLGIEL